MKCIAQFCNKLLDWFRQYSLGMYAEHSNDGYCAYYNYTRTAHMKSPCGLTRRSPVPDIICEGLPSEKPSKLDMPKRVWVRWNSLLGRHSLLLMWHKPHPEDNVNP